MKNTYILLAILFAMALATLTGQYFRGDFSDRASLYAPRSSQTVGAAVEENGLALININQADEETLRLVRGIGETLARRIVEYRRAHGPFSSLDDLTYVKGIGQDTLKRIRDRLCCQ